MQNKNRRRNEQQDHTTTTPPRSQPKAEVGPSSKKSPGKLPDIPPMPTGERASGSQDQPKYDNPETEHEPKGPRGRPSNTKPEEKRTPIQKQPPNRKNPNMTQNGIIASQKPTGTRNTRDI